MAINNDFISNKALGIGYNFNMYSSAEFLLTFSISELHSFL